MIDPLERGDIEELLASRGWQAVRAKLQAMLEDERGRCERGESEPEIRRAQGAAATLRRALSLPEILRSELKKP